MALHIYLGGEEVQFLSEGISEGMYPRIFTGIAEPWINLLEIEACEVRIQTLCTEGLQGSKGNTENLQFLKMCHHVKAQPSCEDIWV